MKDIKLKSSNLVLQKYLEDPMLLGGRKFDLRVFALLTPSLDAYVFETCYVRLSSEQMKLESKADLCNKYMHLTNNAIQELGKNYGIHEQGNIISVPQWEHLVRQAGGHLDFRSTVLPQIEEHVRISMLSCADLLNPQHRWHCFEVYGYDFMLDSRGKVWLIEINTNPSFSESNHTVKTVIERMLDDAFKLTVDKIFVPKRPFAGPKSPVGMQATHVPRDVAIAPQASDISGPTYARPLTISMCQDGSQSEPSQSTTVLHIEGLSEQAGPHTQTQPTDRLNLETRPPALLRSVSLKNGQQAHTAPMTNHQDSVSNTSKPASKSLFPLEQMPDDRNLW